MDKKMENTENYDIIFDKLAEAKNEQQINVGLSESDYSEIDESIQQLHEIQQSIDSSTYTYFTRT